MSNIDGARAKVRVQAYCLTSVPILHAIDDAKRRGLDVVNAQNVVVTESPAVAEWLTRSWEDRRADSRVFGAE